MIELLTIFGWLALILGVLALVWEYVAHRALSRVGAALCAVGVVLLVLAAVLPAATLTYDALLYAP